MRKRRLEIMHILELLFLLFPLQFCLRIDTIVGLSDRQY